MALTAIVLAAGRGRRMDGLTADRPKCLIAIGGATLIERQLAVLRGAGILDVVIATGYRREMLRLPGTREVHNPRWESTNMVETLFGAEGFFGSDVVVAYGDIVYEPRVLAALLANPHAVAVVVDRNWRAYWQARFADPLEDAESLSIDADGRITDIGRPASALDRIEAQYIGLMRFQGAGVDRLRRARRRLGAVPRPWMAIRPLAQAYMTDLLMEMILLGDPVHAVPVEGGWLEFDTVADHERTARMIADGSIIRFYDPAAQGGA